MVNVFLTQHIHVCSLIFPVVCVCPYLSSSLNHFFWYIAKKKEVLIQVHLFYVCKCSLVETKYIPVGDLVPAV